MSCTLGWLHCYVCTVTECAFACKIVKLWDVTEARAVHASFKSLITVLLSHSAPKSSIFPSFKSGFGIDKACMMSLNSFPMEHREASKVASEGTNSHFKRGASCTPQSHTRARAHTSYSSSCTCIHAPQFPRFPNDKTDPRVKLTPQSFAPREKGNQQGSAP